MIVDQVSEVFHWQLGVADHKLAAFLVQSDGDVEEVSALSIRRC